jgi:type IV secretion system protein VirB11
MTTPALQLQYMLRPLDPLLAGGTEDIAINEPGRAFVRRDGAWHAHDVPYDYGDLIDMTTMAASISDKNSGSRDPLLFTDIPLEDRPPLRLMAIQWPAVEPGAISWTLRQPGEQIHSIEEVPSRYRYPRWNQWQHRKELRNHAPALALFDAGDPVSFLRHLVERRYNVLLCGATGSGKTTMGITLLSCIPLHERIVTIENAREYRLNHPNKVHLLYTQTGQHTGAEARVAQKDLQRASLRSRPDRVLVQELLDSDAADTYVEEVISGHPGSLATIHGKGPAQAAKKLFGLVKASPSGANQQDAPVIATLSSAIDCIIPFYSDNEGFEMGEVFFAPDAARRGETFADLLREID